MNRLKTRSPSAALVQSRPARIIPQDASPLASLPPAKPPPPPTRLRLLLCQIIQSIGLGRLCHVRPSVVLSRLSRFQSCDAAFQTIRQPCQIVNGLNQQPDPRLDSLQRRRLLPSRFILPVKRSRRRASATVFRFTPRRAAVLCCPSRLTSHSTTHLRSGCPSSALYAFPMLPSGFRNFISAPRRGWPTNPPDRSIMTSATSEGVD